MKHKICALLLTLVMAMSAGLFSACRQEKQPSGDVNTTDPNGQHGTPETPPEEEQATEGLHYTPIYGEDGTAIGYTVGVGEAVDEEKIVIPAEHDGLPVLRIGMWEDFFEPWPPDAPVEGQYSSTKKFNESYTSYCEGLGYDPQEIEKDVELYLKVTISFFQQYSFVYSKAKTIKVPNGVKEIGFDAFAGSDIESLYLPESVTDFKYVSNLCPLGFCNKLTKIEVSEKNPVYHSEGNCIIETATKTVVAGCKTSVIPEGIRKIAPFAFESVQNLEEINIPKSVTSIGGYAFANCISLRSLKLGLKEVPESFYHDHLYGCTALEEVTFEDGVEKIGIKAFSNCASLKRVSFPSTLKEIGEEAFARCSELDIENMNIPEGATIGHFAFLGTGKFGCSFTLPAMGQDTYPSVMLRIDVPTALAGMDVSVNRVYIHVSEGNGILRIARGPGADSSFYNYVEIEVGESGWIVFDVADQGWRCLTYRYYRIQTSADLTIDEIVFATNGAGGEEPIVLSATVIAASDEALRREAVGLVDRQMIPQTEEI